MNQVWRVFCVIVLVFGAISCGEDAEYSDEQVAEGQSGEMPEDSGDSSEDPEDASVDFGYPEDMPEPEDEPPEEPPVPGCLELSTDVLDFGIVPQEETTTRELTVRNCSGERIYIFDIVLEAYSRFSMATFGGPEALDPGESITLEVDFHPLERDSDLREGVIKIFHNGLPQAVEEVYLKGRGNTCPSATAKGRVAGGEHWFARRVWAALGDTIELSARDSMDPDSRDRVTRGIVAVEWTVVEAPEGSAIPAFAPSNAVLYPRFFAGAVGTYVVELRVFDEHNTSNCHEERLRIVVSEEDARDGTLLPEGNDIEVRLTWESEAADMDLHFLNASQPGARWDAAPWDCFWRNKTPNWGSPSRSDDNPRLDIDNVLGLGPEWVRLDNPEEGAEYRVGAYLYSDEGNGPSNATIAIWIRGEQIYESTTNEPLTSGQFWQPAIISWGEVPEVISVETYHRDFPEGE